MNSDLTPMMRQYLEIKEKHQDAILFFRLGDFYEMFFDDAIEATRILHITLTSRSANKGQKVPMCGVPHHAANNYIARLIKHGKKVAICDQVEDAQPGKGIVKRDVTRIVTPGTYLADELMGAAVNNYILSIKTENGAFGLAYADISTGEFRVTELSDKESLFSELYKISPAECLLPETLSKDEDLKDVNLGAVTVSDDLSFIISIPTLVALSQPLQTIARLEQLIAASLSMIPPCSFCCDFFVCFLEKLTPCTIALLVAG